MSWFAPAAPGDWVRSISVIRTSFTDRMLGGDAGIKPGTSGVVVDHVGWGSLKVRFDTGLFGSVTTTVKSSQVRVTRRGGGVEAHAERAARLRWARAGVGLALLGPVLVFAIRFLISGGSSGGLLVVLLDGAIAGVFDLIGYAFANPLQALLYVAVLTVAGRFAFRA